MSADIGDLRAGKIPRARITEPSDPLDQRILELIETLAHEERLRLLGYAEALTALAPSQQRTNAAAPEDPSPETTKSEQ